MIIKNGEIIEKNIHNGIDKINKYIENLVQKEYIGKKNAEGIKDMLELINKYGEYTNPIYEEYSERITKQIKNDLYNTFVIPNSKFLTNTLLKNNQIKN